MASKSVGGPKAANRAKTVGLSHRTPFKHLLLARLLAREARIYAWPRARLKTWALPFPWHIIDMNAGDGGGVDENGDPCSEETSSPSIINKYAQRARMRRVRIKVTLIEKNEATFQKLYNKANGRPYTELLCQDSRQLQIKPNHKDQAIFVHTDPNALGDWSLTPELIDSFSEKTTMLATLGCNVGGLKRIPPERREQWFGYIKDITSSMPYYHDATLITINNDPSQWAYLVRAPLAWSNEIQDEAIKGSKKFNLPLDMASFRLDRPKFHELQRRLFLTKNELSAY
jgi:hypothetical protein